MANSRKHNRRKTSDYFITQDRSTGDVIGRVLDMSTDGLRLMTMEPVATSRRIKAIIKLQKPVDGRGEIEFDAECRWCLENERAGWYEAGFRFLDLSPGTAAIISRLLKDWVAADSHRRNETEATKEKERRDSPLQSTKSAFRDISPVTDNPKGPGSRP